MDLRWKSPDNYITFAAPKKIKIEPTSPGKSLRQQKILLVTSKSWAEAQKEFPLIEDFDKTAVDEEGPLTEHPHKQNQVRLAKFQVNFFAQSQVREGGVQFGDYAKIRDTLGSWLSSLIKGQVHFHILMTSELQRDCILGMMVAAEMCGYTFKTQAWQRGVLFTLYGEGLSSSPKNLWLMEGRELGRAINLSRYLVDCPPNILNPSSYADYLSKLFQKSKMFEISLWNEKELIKQKMNLHVAVGAGSQTPSILVRLSSKKRASGKGSSKSKKALVGKGITFDSGGLDLKPSSGMRYMKKDMGGSAAVVGVAYYLDAVGAARSLVADYDFYLPLAENSVSHKSFRPSDIFESRSGLTVEIHNTDAEGRLVLADSLTLACEQKPSEIIDVATLTGAIKVALGSEVAGLFANSDGLGDSLLKASEEMGDSAWRMPLVRSYKKQLQSPNADLINAIDGFGGAVTAALFLEAFVEKIPWAHLDIYAWNDKAQGPYLESGGNGQAVQLILRHWNEA